MHRLAASANVVSPAAPGSRRMADTASPTSAHDDVVTRRDFLDLVTWSTLAVGTGALAWPLINQMNPSADVLALSSIEVDLSPIGEGAAVTVKWRGKPVFIRHRTSEEISEADAVPLGELRDPQPDSARATKPEWLIVVGVCTHLGCVPLGNKPGEPRGDYNGWFCPCHGSHYDTAGRVRKGPAPLNLALPEYAYVTDTSVRIG
jgi:ubiquinol-cytochrome c reductase iron-sulfur subunit